jgi:hypothetical protein
LFEKNELITQRERGVRVHNPCCRLGSMFGSPTSILGASSHLGDFLLVSVCCCWQTSFDLLLESEWLLLLLLFFILLIFFIFFKGVYNYRILVIILWGGGGVCFCVLKMSPPKFPPRSLGFLWLFVLGVWLFVVGLPIFGSKFPPRSLGPSVAVFTRLGV